MLFAAAPVWMGPVLGAVIPLMLLTPFIIWMFVKWNRNPEGAVALRTRSDTWSTPGTPNEVLTRIIDRARDRRAFVEFRSDHAADMGIGSQTMFRLWGFLTPSLSIPTRFRIAVRPLDEWQTEVSVEAQSDPGWYAADNRLVDRIYARAFTAILGMLREASKASASTSP